MVIKGEMCGYMRARSKAYDSLDSITSHLKRQHDHGEDIEEYRHHTTFVIHIVRCLFNRYHYKHYAVMTSSSASFFTNSKRNDGGRCASPVWTPGFWTGVVVQRSVRDRCDGHYLPFLLIMDEVVPDLVEAITNEFVHVAPGKDTEDEIKRNRMHRKYPWAH